MELRFRNQEDSNRVQSNFALCLLIFDLTRFRTTYKRNNGKEGNNLKREHSFIPLLLLVCYSILPLFSIIGWICRYNFVLRSYPACSVALAIISLVASVFLLTSKLRLNKIDNILSTLLLPMSAVSGIDYLIHSHTNLTVIFTLVSCCCAIAVFSKFAGPLAFKIIFGILSVLLLILLLLTFIVGYLSHNTVVKSVSSPQKKYVAEVIDNDQGALGGNTLVDVKNNSKAIDLYICEFSQPPVHVYTGKWGEFTEMQISWENEHVLVINGKEYRIND